MSVLKISFVIPCYRSENTIESVVSEIRSVLGQRPEVEWEVVMVSDHSPDMVYRVIERMCQADPGHLKGLELARNFGQHAALMAGYSRVTGDFVLSLDDDGQSPVDAIFALIDKLIDGGYDVVYGTYPTKKHSVFRNVASQINDLMTVWLLGKPASLKVTSFFATRRFVIDEMLNYVGPYPYLYGLVFRITKNIGEVVVNHRARVDGGSGYTFAKLFGLWMNGFTAFSVKPLRLASYAGMLCAFVGFSFGVWAIVNKLVIHPDAPLGYSSLMATLLFIGGMLMLILGLIGEYIGRIYICINRSPQFVVGKEVMNNG